MADYLLKEDGSKLLQETGDKIVLDVAVINAVRFNGSSQWGEIANFAQIDNMTDWYVETYIRRRSTFPEYNPYFSLDNGTDSQFGLSGESGANTTGLNFHQRYDGANDADGYIANGDIPVTEEEWIHIGLRHDSTRKVTTVIINGRPWKDYPGGYPQVGDGAEITLADGIFKLARNVYGDLSPFDAGGFLRIYNRYVNNAEINDNWQKRVAAASEASGLVVNINFTEGTGATLDNEAGYTDMALTGSPTWVAGPQNLVAKDYTNLRSYTQSAADEDGAEQNLSSGDTWSDSSDYEFVFDGANQQIIGVRMPNVVVPQGATIAHAYLRFIAQDDYTAGTHDCTITGEDADNAAQFTPGTGNANISGRTPTTATVAWGIPAIYWRDLVSTPDIAAIVQEIVDRGGWASGNAMSFKFTGSDTDLRNFQSAAAFPYGLGVALHIEYTAGTPANDNRPAVITGKDTATDNRPAVITGKDTTNDNRPAVITGKDSANDNRPAVVTGKDSTSDTRPAVVTGKDTTSDDRPAVITGVDAGTAAEDRPAVVTGKDVANDARNAVITGKDAANDTKLAVITGVDTTNDARLAVITGKETANDNRPAVITGKDSANDNRPAVITGKDATSDSRPAVVTGKETANDSRPAVVTGKDSATDNRPAVVTGQDSTSDTRGAVTTGKDTLNEDRPAVITGQDSANDTRPAVVTGQESTNDEREAVITGKDTQQDDRFLVITGQDAIVAEIMATLWGMDTIFSERGLVLTGFDIAFSERGAVITGMLVRGKPTVLPDGVGLTILSSKQSATGIPAKHDNIVQSKQSGTVVRGKSPITL